MVEKIKNLVETTLSGQDQFFKSGATLDIRFRLNSLNKLRAAIKKRENEIISALYDDLRKSPFEAFSTEIGLVYRELSHHKRNLKKWTHPVRVPSPLHTFPATSHIHRKPYGRVLIISPFNYPFQLNLLPLIGAISGGNVAVLKPSEYTPKTEKIIEIIISEVFDPNHAKVICGNIEISQFLLHQKWDKIFFTGSQKVGKLVLEAATRHLTPVVLEMGGKNPAVVDRDANLKVAATRIAWGKWLNSGQSCVAPDYLIVHEEIRDQFLEHFREVTERFFGSDPSAAKDYTRLIAPEAVDRLAGFLKQGKIVFGGTYNREERYFSPTVITDIPPDSGLLDEEIFGPLIPVITFRNLDEMTDQIGKKHPPLAVYYFSENSRKQKEFLERTTSGDAGINEVVMHFTNYNLPFGGIGTSGMGSYHGKRSFDAFTHERSIMKTSTLIDLPVRYPPFKKLFFLIIRLLFR